ncbi:MAG: EamA family transporter, partial [Desulfovibrio sp.]|nr:EamA family transporter [Desulfovibrio sp.]
GEWQSLHFERLNLGIGLAFLWMVLGGSIIAYSSYFWLLKHVSIPVAVSYEYVVPIIALSLGYFVLDEEVTKTMLCSSALAIASVGLVLFQKHSR